MISTIYKKYLLSFGLVTNTDNLTNAGALFADDSPMWQSRLYCTLWDGKEKGDAINDAELQAMSSCFFAKP